MTTRYMWNELQKLVVIDHDINQIKKKLSQLEQTAQAAREPLPALEKNIAHLKANLHELTKKADTLELDLKTLRAQEDQKKKRLDTLSTPKEYRALENELASLETTISGNEDALTTVWEQQESVQADLLEAEATLENLAATAATIESSQKKERSSLEQEIASHNEAWKVQAAHVPEKLRLTYSEIRTRVENPVVPTISQSCSACFMSLLHQDLAALSKKTVVRCRGCYRFLYTPEEPKSDEEEA